MKRSQENTPNRQENTYDNNHEIVNEIKRILKISSDDDILRVFKEHMTNKKSDKLKEEVTFILII
jgi:hypothetical protein